MIILTSQLSARKVMTDPKLFIAFGLGSGLSKFAPGTIGSLFALCLWYPLSFLSLWVYIFFLVGTFILGIYVSNYAIEQTGVKDYGGIVIDEFLGLWIALLIFPVTLLGSVSVFLVFRLLDIFKPWPIDLIDKKVEEGLGVMLDDIIAGLLTFSFFVLLKVIGISI